MVEADLQLVAVDALHRPHPELLVEHPVADRETRRLRAVHRVSLALDDLRPAADRTAAAPQIAGTAPGDTARGIPTAATGRRFRRIATGTKSAEHKPELQSLMSISYAVFCLKN